MTNPEQELKAKMAEFDLHPPSITFDQKIHRFKAAGDKGSHRGGCGWVRAFADERGAVFGCYRTGVDEKWQIEANGQTKPTDEERAEWAEQTKARAAEARAKRDAAALKAERTWKAAEKASADHPYLVAKGIKPTGLRQVKDKLICPMRSKSNKIISLQSISVDPEAASGFRKRFMVDGWIKGTYASIGSRTASRDVIYVTEGWATGATINEITGAPTAVAYYADNLKAVAKIMRDRFPDSRIILAADNDYWTQVREGRNPGVIFARKAAEAIGAEVAIPEFPDTICRDPDCPRGDGCKKDHPTDFNDLHAMLGADAVKKWLDPATIPVPFAVVPSTEVGPPPEPAEIGYAWNWNDRDPKSPFRCLGYDRDSYFYLPKGGGQIATRTVSQHDRRHLHNLAEASWWERTFPGGGKDPVNWAAAADAMFTINHRLGVFRIGRIRGRGCWSETDADGNPGVLLHLGDALLPAGESKFVAPESYVCRKNQIYEQRGRLDGPDRHEAMDLAGAQELLALFNDLRWMDEASGTLLAGWTVMAPFCGALQWRPHVWLIGGAGAGKAQPHSSRVLTPSGWLTMGDLASGDYVTAPDGVPSRIIDVYPQGTIDVYKITFRDGRTAEASADHLWKIRRRNKWKLCTTLELAALLEGGQPGRIAIPLPDALEIRTDGGSSNKRALPLHPYVLGAFLGDGSLSGHTTELTSFDDHIVQRIRGLLPKGSSLSAHSNGVSFGLCSLSFYSHENRDAVKDLRTLGFGNKQGGLRSWEKFIPVRYLDASIADRIELLKGLMDTDGTAGTNGCMSYCTVSPALRDGFVRLVRSLGGTARVGVRHPYYTGKDGERREGREAYVISIRLPDRSVAFSLPRKIERVSGDYQYEDTFYLQVTSIEKTGQEECSCIRIDHPDSLYVTDNFVVTHNTWIIKHLVLRLLGGRRQDHGMAEYVEGFTTEAGIRAGLQSDARPVIYDEADRDDQKSDTRIQSVLALARSSSSSGASVQKGTPSGKGMSFEVRAMFLLSSIAGSLRQEGDRTRISMLQLESVPKKDNKEAQEARRAHWRKYLPRLQRVDTALGRKLMARTLLWLRDGRMTTTIETMKSEAAVVLGDQRSGDQYGTLFAGAWSLMADDVPDAGEARELIASHGLSTYLSDQAPEGARVLRKLLQHTVRIDRKGGGPTTHAVGELVEASMPGNLTDKLHEDAERFLKMVGIRCEVGDNGAKIMLLANISEWIADVLKDSMYADSWTAALRSLPGVHPGKKAVHFHSGLNSRVTIVPQDSFE